MKANEAPYRHTITPIEEACGVTLDDVARELPRGTFRENGNVFVVAESCGPALAGSVARAAFGGSQVEYVSRSPLGRVYARAAHEEA